MKKLLWPCLMVLLLAVMTGVALAGGKKGTAKPAGVDGMINGSGIRGVLTVSTNEQGVASAQIDPKKGTVYNLVMSSLIQNISVLKDLNGMEVLAKGEIREIDGKKWLTVEGLIAKADTSNSGGVRKGKKNK